MSQHEYFTGVYCEENLPIFDSNSQSKILSPQNARIASNAKIYPNTTGLSCVLRSSCGALTSRVSAASSRCCCDVARPRLADGWRAGISRSNTRIQAPHPETPDRPQQAARPVRHSPPPPPSLVSRCLPAATLQTTTNTAALPVPKVDATFRAHTDTQHCASITREWRLFLTARDNMICDSFLAQFFFT